MNAASIGGFVPGISLVIGLTTGDYHGQMNGENFTKWMLEKYLSNIPCQNVIVLDSAYGL